MDEDDEHQGNEVDEVLQKYRQSDDQDELDFSSCDLDAIPKEVFEIAREQLMTLVLDYNNIDTLSPLIGQLLGLVELTLNGNELSALPSQISNLVRLETLMINENRLCSLPNEIGDLCTLKTFSAVGNNLTCLPTTLTKLQNLEELLLDENQISHLPVGFGELCSLKVLEMCHNNLGCLPEDIGDVEPLEVLSCGSNEIKKLPDSILKLRNVRYMDFSHNKIEAIPEGEDGVEIHLLEKLFLEDNALKLLPAWLSRLALLEELTLSDNALCNEPFDTKFCENMPNLRKLEVGANFISSLADNFGNMVSLEYLHFGSTISELERSNFQNGNWIIDLPDSMCSLRNLKKLNMNENQIARLPDLFGDLCSLSYLDLGQNMLVTLPDSFSRLSNLEYLQLSKNQLRELPRDLGGLRKLNELRLDHNLLTEVPESVGSITTLQALDLFHNRLTEIPSFIGKLCNLKRLDIDRNNFTLDMSKVPRIMPEVKYPKRESSLKDNWRGKYRADKYAPGAVKEIVFDLPPPGEENNNEEEEEESPWNENALRMALERGMSLWRSHTGPSTRDSDESRPAGTVDNDNWVAVNINRTINTDHIDDQVDGEERDPDEEDWDEEIEEHQMQRHIQRTTKVIERKMRASFYDIIQSYPPSAQAFTPTASYDSIVFGKAEVSKNEPVLDDNPNFVVVDGQFDDD